MQTGFDQSRKYGRCTPKYIEGALYVSLRAPLEKGQAKGAVGEYGKVLGIKTRNTRQIETKT